MYFCFFCLLGGRYSLAHGNQSEGRGHAADSSRRHSKVSRGDVIAPMLVCSFSLNGPFDSVVPLRKFAFQSLKIISEAKVSIQ